MSLSVIAVVVGCIGAGFLIAGIGKSTGPGTVLARLRGGSKWAAAFVAAAAVGGSVWLFHGSAVDNSQDGDIVFHGDIDGPSVGASFGLPVGGPATVPPPAPVVIDKKKIGNRTIDNRKIDQRETDNRVKVDRSRVDNRKDDHSRVEGGIHIDKSVHTRKTDNRKYELNVHLGGDDAGQTSKRTNGGQKAKARARRAKRRNKTFCHLSATCGGPAPGWVRNETVGFLAGKDLCMNGSVKVKRGKEFDSFLHGRSMSLEASGKLADYVGKLVQARSKSVAGGSIEASVEQSVSAVLVGMRPGQLFEDGRGRIYQQQCISRKNLERAHLTR